MNESTNLWRRWRAYRAEVRRGMAFLALPHDDNDPECVRWWGDRPGMDWKARCPTCNPEPVHYIHPRIGGAVHAFPDVTAPARFDDNPAKVTCVVCLGVIERDKTQAKM